MILTSYFAKINRLPKNYIPVSICLKAPDWFDGSEYKELAPKKGFFNAWKKNKDNAYYIEHFKSEVIESLNAKKVLSDLEKLIPKEIKNLIDEPIYLSNKWHIVLVCYEKSDEFCHRHIVAKWLKENNIECKEIYYKQK